ncbi:hypothetical protein IWQ60_002721 [Tieghemiomyces parasiticus]|uniref:Uncharacterized protein n=1 Tax=Tieghemiomyces parasiticus TaxID=78921 RepID=A0A9W8AEL1_9FUNG|nr:hypothetical protein IWQ60_002721 [Tieghemiomyces parasiticus]
MVRYTHLIALTVLAVTLPALLVTGQSLPNIDEAGIESEVGSNPDPTADVPNAAAADGGAPQAGSAGPSTCPATFDKNAYDCVSGTLCPKGNGVCGTPPACYQKTLYNCVNNALVQIAK